MAKQIGIDLGTSNTRIYLKDKGIVLRAPSVVSIDRQTHEVIASGRSAKCMVGKTPGNILALRPLKDGVITDDDIYGNLIDILSGEKPGRENDEEFIYFDAVGLSYVDVSIAYAMYQKALQKQVGRWTYLQENMIFEKDLAGKIIL